jgi:hypothetical protein
VGEHSVCFESAGQGISAIYHFELNGAAVARGCGPLRHGDSWITLRDWWRVCMYLLDFYEMCRVEDLLASRWEQGALVDLI